MAVFGLGTIGCGTPCECGGSCSTMVCVAGQSGVTVTVTPSSGGATVMGITGSGGSVSLTIPGTGSYLVTATGTGISYSGTQTLTCGGTLIFAKICATGCSGLYQPGAAVTVLSGVTTIASGITDSNGCFLFVLPAVGSYTVQIVLAGFTTFSSTESLGCGTYAYGLTANAWTCFCATNSDCPSMPYNTVTINDGQGNVTCTYTGSIPILGGAGYYGYTTRTTINAVLYCSGGAGGVGGLCVGLPTLTGNLTVPVMLALVCLAGPAPNYNILVGIPLCLVGGAQPNWFAGAGNSDINEWYNNKASGSVSCNPFLYAEAWGGPCSHIVGVLSCTSANSMPTNGMFCLYGGCPSFTVTTP